MTWYSQSMLTIGHHLPGAGSLVNGNKGAIGNVAVNTSLVPSSLEDLGLVMEETEDPAVGWGRSLVNGGGQQVPRGDPLMLPPKAVNRTGHNPTSYGFQERATTVGFNGGPVVNPGGLAMGTVQSLPGSIHQPIVVNGPRVNINQSVVYQCDPGMAMPNHVPLPQAGRVVARRPVILDRVGRKEQLVEFDPNGMLGYILVPNGELHAEEQSAMGKVVRLERTMSYGDPKQVRYVMNEIVLGPTTSEPSVNHNGAGDHSVYSSVNGTYPGHHPLGDIAHVTEQVGAPRSYGYVPPWHQGVHTQNVSYRHNWSGGGMANHHGVPGTVPQFDQPMQSTGSNNGAAGLSLLQSALMGAPTAEVDEGAFAHYLSKKQEQGRAENASAKKAGSAPRSRGKKGVLAHSQQTLAPPGVATPPKRPRQRKKKGEGGQVVGGSVLPSPLSTARPKGQAKRTYSRKKGGGDLVVQGEAEEIVVEVDLPMMLSDDDDDEENDGRGVEEEVGYWGEKESGADPLAPNLEDSRAVDAMRTQNVRGNGFHCTLMNWKRKLVMLPKQVTVLGDEKSRGRAATGRKKSKGRLPPVLKECYVRLERCDAPRPAAKNSRKEEPSSSKAKEEKSTQSKGSDPTSVPSAEESSSPPDSPCKTPNSQRQETDYWLKMLDRERREAFEALKAVRKRLDEEKASCSVALMSVRSSVIEKEFASEGSGLEGSSLSSSLDDIQWALLEEEFKKREELKRKSASDSSSSSVVEEAAPVTPTQDPRPMETRVADAKSAEGVARQRRGRPNGSRKMIGWRKDDSSVSSSQEGSNILEDNRALSKFLGGGESSSSVVAVPDGRVAMPEGGICDPRIAELQRKYRSERVRGAGRVPRTRECRVRLERLGSGAGRGRGVVGRTANASSGMVVDSVEMTLSVTANPVERGDSLSRTSFVCLQGRVGLKRKSQSDLMAVGGRALSRDERQVSSSNSPGRRVLMVQLNKLVVVTKEFNKFPPDTPALESTRLPALEGPKTVKSEAEHHTGYRGRSRTEVAADSERGSPRLKKCFVLLERCDKMNGDSGSGPPPKKRRMRII